MTPPPPPSQVRLTVGVLCFLASLGVLPFAFTQLNDALEGPGYGSPEVRVALIVLGVGGAMLGTGVALLIWETAVRLRHW